MSFNGPGSPRVGILFSGGLDSIVLARLADLFIPVDEYVILIALQPKLYLSTYKQPLDP